MAQWLTLHQDDNEVRVNADNILYYRGDENGSWLYFGGVGDNRMLIGVQETPQQVEQAITGSNKTSTYTTHNI